jgi:hypothetical protein
MVGIIFVILAGEKSNVHKTQLMLVGCKHGSCARDICDARRATVCFYGFLQ